MAVEPEIPAGLLAAWFGGTHEGHPDVSIWLARMDGAGWGRPAKVADVPGVALWNPVLFGATGGPIWLFFKIGPNVSAWSGAYIQSYDHGETWTRATVLPAGLLGLPKQAGPAAQRRYLCAGHPPKRGAPGRAGLN